MKPHVQTDVARGKPTDVERQLTMDLPLPVGECAAGEPSATDASSSECCDDAAQPTATVRLREGGKSAVIDGVTLFTEGGDDITREQLLKRVVALLGDDRDSAAALGGGERLKLSNGGGRLDHPASGISMRVRGPGGGAQLARARALLTKIAALWNDTEDGLGTCERVDDRGSTRTPAALCDELGLHRFHLTPRGRRVRLVHHELRLSSSITGGTADQARAFAWRIALAWNMAEGWPAKAAEAGALRALDDAVHQLVEAHERGQDCSNIIALIAARLRHRDALQDLQHERVFDCAQCVLAEGDSSSEDADESLGPTQAFPQPSGSASSFSSLDSKNEQ